MNSKQLFWEMLCSHKIQCRNPVCGTDGDKAPPEGGRVLWNLHAPSKTSLVLRGSLEHCSWGPQVRGLLMLIRQHQCPKSAAEQVLLANEDFCWNVANSRTVVLWSKWFLFSWSKHLENLTFDEHMFNWPRHYNGVEKLWGVKMGGRVDKTVCKFMRLM